MIAVSIVGNFFAGLAWPARIGYRRAIAAMCLRLRPRHARQLRACRAATRRSCYFWLPLVGFFSGVFGLFTMYMPPLFPTLLRTTGAGFCYNIGRVAAAFGTVFFGLFAPVGDFRLALLYASFLLPVAVAVAWTMPDLAAD